MKYRHKFINAVRREFKGCHELEKLLEASSVFLGRYLEKKSKIKISPDEIVLAFETKQEHKIKVMADKAIRARKLHDEWKKQYRRAVERGKQQRIEELLAAYA